MVKYISLIYQLIYRVRGTQALMKIDFEREFTGISKALNESGCRVNYFTSWAMIKKLASVLLKNPRVLHFSGHGVKNSVQILGTEASLRKDEGDFLIFETRKGYAELVSEKMLADLLKQCKTEIELVFVSSCHSELIGHIFFNAGVSHVICIKEEEKISDEASITFAKAFYQSLFTINNKSIWDAFKAAKQSVKFQGGIDSWGVGEDNKYIMLSKWKGKWTSFDTDLSIGKMWDLSEKPEFSVLPTRVEHFIGRSRDCQKIVECLNNHRLISVTGVSGIGKSAVMKELSHYIIKRNIFTEGVVYVSLVDCQTIENFTKRLILIIRNQLSDDHKIQRLATRFISTHDDAFAWWLNLLKIKNILLILDNCDNILKYDNVSFSVMIETLIHKCEKLHIVMSSQIPMGNISDTTTKVINIEPLRPEDSLSLLKKKSIIEITDEELQELMEDLNISWKSYNTESLSLKDHPLFKMVNGHPMALIMIASLRKEMRLKQIYELLALIQQESDQSFTSENISINLSMEAWLLFLKNIDMNAYINLIMFALLPAGISNVDWYKLFGNQWEEYRAILLSKSVIVQRASISKENQESGTFRIEAAYKNFILSRASDDELKQCEKRIIKFMISKFI